MDSLTSTSESKDCPGVCVHTLATIICYEVLEDIQCPQANQKCCVESNAANVTSESTPVTTTTTTTTTPKPTTQKITSKPEKSPNKTDPGKGILTYEIIFNIFFFNEHSLVLLRWLLSGSLCR